MTYQDRLTKHVEAIQSDLNKENAEKKRIKNSSREKTAFDKLPEYTPRMEFWCDHCLIDFVAPAYKTWSNIHNTGSWQSFCPVCESQVYRYASSKKLDPYYAKSDKIKIMRGEHLVDMLQPGEYGFQTEYGDPFEHYYRRFQQRHEDLHNRYASMGLLGRTLKQKEEEEMIKEEMGI